MNDQICTQNYFLQGFSNEIFAFTFYTFELTLHVVSMSEMALRPILAATMISSCLRLFPAETAFPVARVMGLVARIRSSGSALLLGASDESKALIS